MAPILPRLYNSPPTITSLGPYYLSNSQFVCPSIAYHVTFGVPPYLITIIDGSNLVVETYPKPITEVNALSSAGIYYTDLQNDVFNEGMEIAFQVMDSHGVSSHSIPAFVYNGNITTCTA